MADFRQRAPEINPVTEDPRLFNRVRSEGSFADAALAGVSSFAQNMVNNPALSGSQGSISGSEQRARLNAEQEALDRRSQDEVAYTLAQDTASMIEARMSQLFAGSQVEDVDADLRTLSDTDRLTRSFELAAGQGKFSSLARARGLAEVNRMIRDNPRRSAEIMSAFQSFTGETYMQAVSKELEEAQANEIRVSANAIEQYESLTQEFGLPPGTPPSEVFRLDRQRKRNALNLESLKRQHDTLIASNGIAQEQFVARTREDRQARDRAQIRRDTAAARNESASIDDMNRLMEEVGQAVYEQVTLEGRGMLNQYPDPTTMSPQEVESLVAEVEAEANSLATQISTQYSGAERTPQQILDSYPIINDTKNRLISYLRGETSAEVIGNQLEFYQKEGQRNALAVPGMSENYGITQVLNDMTNPDVLSVEMRNSLRENYIPIYDQLDSLMRGGVSNTPGSNQGLERAPENFDAAFNYLGIMLSDEAIGQLDRQSGLAIEAMGRVAEQLGENPSRIPVKYYDSFARFTASEQGMKALENYASETGTPETFDNFLRGYNNYMNRTGAALASDLRDETIEGLAGNVRVADNTMEDPLFGFLFANYQAPITQFASVVQYEVLANGNIAFAPRPEFNRNPRVVEKARSLNRKYSSRIQNQVRSYAHMINKDQNYKQAFKDMFEAGEFNVNQSDENLLNLIRRNNPEFSNFSDEEILEEARNLQG